MDIQTALDGLTVEEQIDLIDKENFSREEIEEACFWSLGVFFARLTYKAIGYNGSVWMNPLYPTYKCCLRVINCSPVGCIVPTIREMSENRVLTHPVSHVKIALLNGNRLP